MSEATTAAAGNDQTTPLQQRKKKKKRAICDRCSRPKPRACLCSALPAQPVSLQHCQVVVLQHPHEAKRKNRSLPLVELCLQKGSLHTVVARRLGDQGLVDPSVLKLIQDPQRDLLLVYPGADSVSLTEALHKLHQKWEAASVALEKTSNKITVLVLDGTWKYVREMEKANCSTKQYPDHLIRVKLRPEDWLYRETNGDDSGTNQKFQPYRFDIRTPPSPDHLSTGECIAWVVARIEEDPSIYETIMKPLDLMVKQWHSFSDGKINPSEEKRRAADNEDAKDVSCSSNRDDDKQPPKKQKR